MEIKTKKLPNAEMEIIVKLTEEDFKKDLDDAAKYISKEVKISGFRPGKVPFDVLVEHVGKEAIVQQALDTAIPRFLTKAIQDEKLTVIARPKVDVVSLEPIEFKAIAPVYPDVKVDGYEKIKIKLKETKVTQADIDEAFDRVKKQFVGWEDKDGKIEDGDKVEIDFEGFDDGGAPLEGTDSKNHPLVIGQGMMVPGFEENIIGLKKDDDKEFDVTFPKDYHKKTFQDKKVTFKVKIKKVEKATYPEFNEEFIEKLTGKKQSEEEFTKMVEKDLLEHKKSENMKKNENELIEEFYKLTKTQYSEILVEEELDHMIHELKHDMQHRGLKFDQYLQHLKKTEEELRKDMKKEADKRLKIRFGIHEIMQKEKINIEDKAVDEEILKNGGDKKDKEMRARVVNSLRISQLFDRFLQK